MKLSLGFLVVAGALLTFAFSRLVSADSVSLDKNGSVVSSNERPHRPAGHGSVSQQGKFYPRADYYYVRAQRCPWWPKAPGE